MEEFHDNGITSVRENSIELFVAEEMVVLVFLHEPQCVHDDWCHSDLGAGGGRCLVPSRVLGNFTDACFCRCCIPLRARKF